MLWSCPSRLCRHVVRGYTLLRAMLVGIPTAPEQPSWAASTGVASTHHAATTRGERMDTFLSTFWKPNFLHQTSSVDGILVCAVYLESTCLRVKLLNYYQESGTFGASWVWQASYKIYGWLSGNLALFVWQPPRPDLALASTTDAKTTL